MAEAQENPNVEEQEEEECPKCPPPGAPAWMATFADMATLLMAFFVLILSFAEFNVPKFKQISGSLKNAFGIQRVVPVVEQPRGTTVLALNFSPSPDPSVTKNMTQQSTNTEQKNLDLKSEEDKRESSKSSSESIEKAKKLEEALKSIDLDKSVSTEVIDDKVVVKINNEKSKDIQDVVSETITAIEDARNKSGNYDTDVLIGGINSEIKAIAMASQNNKALIDKIENLEELGSIPHRIRQMLEKSDFNNDKSLLTEAVIEIEIHANVDSLKKDQPIRDKMNLKVLQDKFNSNLNEQEKFYQCLEKFFNNLSSKNPNQDEKRLWKRIVKTNPRLS